MLNRRWLRVDIAALRLFLRLVPAENQRVLVLTLALGALCGLAALAFHSGVVVAAALAAVIERSVLGTHPVFTLPPGYGLHHASSLVLYALLGVAAALVAVAFSESLLGLRARFQRLRAIPPWARPALGGLLTGVLAVVALLTLHTGRVTGAGYATLSNALAGKLALHMLVALCALKKDRRHGVLVQQRRRGRPVRAHAVRGRHAWRRHRLARRAAAGPRRARWARSRSSAWARYSRP